MRALSRVFRMCSSETLFEHLHLVFETELQFFKSDFFELVLFRVVGLVDEGVELLGVELVFLSQTTKFVVAGQENLAYWSGHLHLLKPRLGGGKASPGRGAFQAISRVLTEK
jgi:hypothetical protein